MQSIYGNEMGLIGSSPVQPCFSQQNNLVYAGFQTWVNSPTVTPTLFPLTVDQRLLKLIETGNSRRRLNTDGLKTVLFPQRESWCQEKGAKV